MDGGGFAFNRADDWDTVTGNSIIRFLLLLYGGGRLRYEFLSLYRFGDDGFGSSLTSSNRCFSALTTREVQRNERESDGGNGLNETHIKQGNTRSDLE